MSYKASDIIFRCSAIANIMSNGRGITEKQLETIAQFQAKEKLTPKQSEELQRLIHKRDNPELPEGVKTHLVDLFVSHRYGRREEVFGKAMTKGNDREEDALTLLSIMKKKTFDKNSVRLRNEYIQGEPDTFIGPKLEEAEETFDTKCSWSAHTHFRALNAPLCEDYFFQGQGYMALTGAKYHSVVRCLMNTPARLINEEKRRALWNFENNPLNDSYREHCKQIEINHIFDLDKFLKENPDYEFHMNLADWNFDIPQHERIYVLRFDRDQEVINKIYARIRQCREWMDAELFKIAAAEAVAQ